MVQTGLAKRSEERGDPKAALRRFGKLRHMLERRAASSIDTPWHRALLHSLEAGVQSRARQVRDARRSYLLAASVSFTTAWAAIDLLTNSMWAAELERDADTRTGRVRRVEHCRRIDHQGARFLKVAGDMLNEQLLRSGLRVIVFGGKYPAKIAGPLGQRTASVSVRTPRGARRRPTRG
jgi:hypothetical protein